MDSNHNKPFNQDLTNFLHTHPTTPTTYYQWPYHRQIPLRRRKLSYVRLGGKKPRRRRLFLVRIFQRVRLRWLRVKQALTLKKLKEHYRCLIKDIVEGSAGIEAVQQRILMETSFAIPVLGISFNTFPNAYAP